MPLELQTITFNHDLASAATSALNIRKNKDFETALPEFDRTILRTPQQQCAAYSIASTRNQPVFVRCVVNMPAGAPASVEIRATGGGVLGELDAVTVSIPDAADVTVDFPLEHRAFDAVGRHDVTWQWEWRIAGARAPWTPLASTSHRVYLLLDMPGAPWTQVFADKRNPWTDLLDHVCVIAAGKSTEMAASIAMTRAIFSNYSLRYDIVSGAPTYGFNQTTGSFRLTQWITNVLEGSPPATPLFCSGTAEQYNDNWIVNCYDAAASLALMSKAVGARLDNYFHSPFGKLQFVLPIGRGRCNNPFYGCTSNDPVRGANDATRTGFGNHAYTKSPANNNFDACMKKYRSWLEVLILTIVYFILWLLVLILSFGTVNRTDLFDRAQGWLVNLSQGDYNATVIDTSTPAEAASAAGATQVPCALDFSVT